MKEKAIGWGQGSFLQRMEQGQSVPGMFEEQQGSGVSKGKDIEN